MTTAIETPGKRRAEVRASNQDPEMLAMTVIIQALDNLDAATAARVLGWAEARYGIEAQQLAVDRLNDSMLSTLQAMTTAANSVSSTAAELNLSPSQLRVALLRLYNEASKEASEDAITQDAS